MTEHQSIGLVGLGVMGLNLALNMMDHGFAVVAHDPWPEAREQFAGSLDSSPAALASVAATPGDLAAQLPAPRVILIMVKAGAPVDAVIEGLLPHLDPGDILIDGGNSRYQDTTTREAGLKTKGIGFIGLGISGGEQGARHGPSLMAGGDSAAFERARPMLEAIAARYEGVHCCARVGGDGAGHFVKMVHNGIEYAVMQLIAEAYMVLRDLGKKDHGAMAAAFRAWNDGRLSSYLMEITARILDRSDDLGAGPLVERILDTGEQKGTGRWCSEAALAFGVPTPTLTEAVFARSLAALKTERVAAAEILAGPAGGPAAAGDAMLVENLELALLGATVTSYAQGLSLIDVASRENGWDIDLAKVATIWRAGCVIRARLLDDVMAAFGGPDCPQNLMEGGSFADLLSETQHGWRRIVADAAGHGLPIPAFVSALAYYDGYRAARLPANLVQAQRDCFGAHGYERVDRPGKFHTNW